MASDVFSISGSYDLVDKVSGKLDKIGKDVDKHGDKVKKTEKDYDNLGSSLGSKASGIAKSVAMAFSVTAIVGFGKQMATLGSDAMETEQKFEAVFKGMTGQAKEFADGFSKEYGRYDADVQNMLTTTMTMGKNYGLTAERSLELSQSLQLVTADVGAFNDMEDADVHQRLIAAMRGEGEAAEALGLSINQTTLAEYARKKGMDKTIDKMSQAELVELRYGLILEQTGDASGYAKKESEGYASQLRSLKSNLKEVGEQIGRAFVPALASIVGGLSDGVTKIMEFGSKVSEGFGVFKTELAASGEPTYAFGEMFKTIFGVELPQSAYNMVDDIILGFQTLWTTFQSIWDTVATPIIDIIKDVFTGVGSHSDKIFEGIGAAFLFYCNMIKDTWDLVGKPLWDFVIQIIGWVKDMFVEHWDAIKQVFDTVIGDLVNIWETNLKPMFEAIGNFITNVLAPVFHWLMDNVISPVFGAIVNFIGDAWTNGIKPVFTGIIDFITGVFSGDWGKAWDGVCSIFSGIFGGLGALIKAPLNAVIGIINKAIDGINSISVSIPNWVKTNKVAQYKDGEFGGSLSLPIAS